MASVIIMADHYKEEFILLKQIDSLSIRDLTEDESKSLFFYLLKIATLKAKKLSSSLWSKLFGVVLTKAKS